MVAAVGDPDVDHQFWDVAPLQVDVITRSSRTAVNVRPWPMSPARYIDNNMVARHFLRRSCQWGMHALACMLCCMHWMCRQQDANESRQAGAGALSSVQKRVCRDVRAKHSALRRDMCWRQVTAGADLGGQVAAALAAGSMLFKSSDPAYSATLLDGARRAYAFAQASNGVKCAAPHADAPFAFAIRTRRCCYVKRLQGCMMRYLK